MHDALKTSVIPDSIEWAADVEFHQLNDIGMIYDEIYSKKNDHASVIEFGANYFSDSILNSLENINHKQNETVKYHFIYH